MNRTDMSRRGFFALGVYALVEPLRRTTNIGFSIDIHVVNAYNEYLRIWDKLAYKALEEMRALPYLYSIDMAYHLGGLGHLLDTGSPIEQKYLNAIRMFDYATNKNPNFAHAYSNSGLLHLLLGNMSYLESGRQLSSEQKEHLDTAFKLFNKAVEKKPSLFSAQFNMGRLLFAKREYLKASEAFTNAIKIGHKNPSWKNLKPTGSKEFTGESFIGGMPLSLISGLYKYHYDTHQTLVVDGNSLYNQGGLAFIQSENDPSAFANYFLGMCALKLQDRVTARQAFEKAIELNPHVPNFYDGFNKMLLNGHFFKEAFDIEEKGYKVATKVSSLLQKQ